MEEKILELLNLGVVTLDKIANNLHLSKKRTLEILDRLVDENLVFYNKSYHEYGILKQGIIEIKSSGYGFINVDNEEKDYYADASSLKMVFDRDEVLFYAYDDGSKLLNARIIRVIQRGHSFIIGKYHKRIRKGKIKDYIESTNPSFPVTAIVKSGPTDITNGMIVYASIQYVGTAIEAKIREVLGHPDDPGIEITQIALEYGFQLEFPVEVVEEISKIPTEVQPLEYQGRKDFTDRLIFTIDGSDSKDFDDAISLTKTEDGLYQLGVYIADVAHYVKEGSPLDIEALKRGTSVYLADRVIPMIPHKLSNGICSLNEGVPRLVMACLMTISPKGNLVDYEITEGVICSRHRMTYDQVNYILTHDEVLCKQYSDIAPTLFEMQELAHILRNKRMKKGGLSFETKEFKFKLNEDGSPKEIIPLVSSEGEHLIEDFMLMANETVAYHLNIMNLPCIYRIHEKPDQEKLAATFLQLKMMGLEVVAGKKNITPKQIQDTLDLVTLDNMKPIVNHLLLRSMMKAKYSSHCLGHYGLAMKYYCHFTSPIRRYPDLMVHRILKRLCLHPEQYEKDVSHFESLIGPTAVRNSLSEKNSVECERAVNDMLYAWYMEKHIHSIFTGMITSMTSFGIFVTLDNGVEGLVSLNQMIGYFELDSDKMIYSNGSISYHLGQRVEVVVLGADRKSRKIDFMMRRDYDEDRLYE